MVKLTPIHIGAAASVLWLLLWILVFDRWFFFTPIGLFIAIGIPLAGWAVWWKFYRGEEQKIVVDGRQALDRSTQSLLRLKKRISKQQ